MNIDRVALCFYGQWRTGSIVLPSYVSILSELQKDVELNVFFSVKPVDHAEHEIRETIFKTLGKFSNSITINILVDPQSEHIADKNKSHKTLYGIIDPIIMKQHYEIRNNVYHDMVILVRPDVFMFDRYIFKNIVNLLRSTNDMNVMGVNTDSILYVAYNPSLDEEFSPLSMMPDQISDHLVVYTGTAADRFCYECCDLLSMYTGFFGGVPLMHNQVFSLHSIHTLIARRLSINLLPFPRTYSAGLHQFEDIQHSPEESVRFGTVRHDMVDNFYYANHKLFDDKE